MAQKLSLNGGTGWNKGIEIYRRVHRHQKHINQTQNDALSFAGNQPKCNVKQTACLETSTSFWPVLGFYLWQWFLKRGKKNPVYSQQSSSSTDSEQVQLSMSTRSSNEHKGVGAAYLCLRFLPIWLRWVCSQSVAEEAPRLPLKITSARVEGLEGAEMAA